MKTGPHPCVVCKTVVDTSRPAQKVHAAQLGMKEEELTGDARVCNTCWCKTLKKKHSAVCPVPTCTSNKVRSRGKLRHLPKKWGDLDKASKETVMNELGLPEKTKHVCAACFTRITRRISQLEVTEQSSSKSKKEEELVAWAEEAIEKAKGSLRQYGTNWSKMAEAVRDKTEDQCKKFFYNQRKRLQLDKLVQEYKRANRPGGDDKPSLTSDEESGSSTSSGEEGGEAMEVEGEDKGKELKPPAVPPPAEQRVEAEAKKTEDYNSADTMSADETGEMVGPAKKGQQGKGAKMVDPQGFMEAVITRTLDKGVVPSTSTPSPAVTTATTSINLLLEHAGPSPHRTNYVREGLTSGRPKEVGPPIVLRPEQELRALPAQPAAQGGDGVLDFSMTKPERSSPAPGQNSGPTEHSSYHGYPKIREPVPESQGKEPPAAHGGGKAKTSHKEVLNMMSLADPAFMYRPDAKSPAPFADPRSSMHSPGPGQLPQARGDPRNGLPSHVQPKSHPPPLHPNKSSTAIGPPGLTVTPSRPGSLVEGTPKVRPVHGAGQGSPRDYPAHHPGSIMKGQPVYRPQDPAPRMRMQQPPHQDPRTSHNPARGSPYPGYQPRPAGHEPGPRISSRSIIEGDYTIAQSMPKHPREQGTGFPRTIDPHRREASAVDPRLDPRADPRNLAYAPRFGATPPFGGRGDPREVPRGDPRAELPGSRGDPRAEIPGVRGDPRAERDEIYRGSRHPDPRDPRSVPMLDPRTGRAQQLYPPGYPDPRAQPPRSRSPPRAQHPQAAPSPQGSIQTGKPRAQERDPYPRHPEVSITKQQILPGGSQRPDGYGANLDTLAQLADTQQRLPEGRSHSRDGSRQMPPGMLDPRAAHYAREKELQARAAQDPRGGPSREQQQRMMEQQQYDRSKQQQAQQAQAQQQAQQQANQQAMIDRITQMSEQDRAAYLETLKNSARAQQPDHMSAASLIDLIITHQINRNTVPAGSGPPLPGPGNPRRSPQAPQDGKESPSKLHSHSPSVKGHPEGLEAGGPSGSAVRTSPGTMGEHIENMISKEVGRGGGSPYPGPSGQQEHEHWKRRGYGEAAYRPPSQPRPPSNSHPGLSTDERVIQRVVQNASPASSTGRPDKPPSRGMHEAISPPSSAAGYPPHTMYPGQAPIEPAMAKFFATARRKEEAERAAAQSRASGAGVSHFDDYVKYKITEVMKNEKSAGGAGPSEPKPPSSHALTMGPPHKRPLEQEARGSPQEHGSAGQDSPSKRYKRDEGTSNDMPDSPESGDMVIDESARPDSAHSQKTNSPAPAPPLDPAHYPGYRGGPAGPPRSSPAPQGARPPPQPSGALARYEPLSDDD